jgi:2-keto-4-pentenoate hydratase
MNHTTIANALLLSRQNATLCAPPSDDPHYSLHDAYAVAKIHLDTCLTAGMQPIGRKIGFTNPTAWPSMGLNTPVWGYVYNNSVFDTTQGHTTHNLRGTIQPKIEPEIMFGLKAPVPGTGDPVDALGAVAWIALGFEVVTCPYPDWKFKGVDAVSAFGLHRALFVGAKRMINADDDLVSIVAALGSMTARLSKNGAVVAEGSGKIVLGNPAKALAALGVITANQPQFAPLSAGEIISSGTLTVPPVIAAGDVFRGEVAGFDLAPVQVSFE